jgi:hypothetical protein
MTSVVLAMTLATLTADVCIPTQAVDTLATTDEVFRLDADTLADAQSRDARSDCGYFACQLMPILAANGRRVRAGSPGVFAPIAMEVAPTDTGGFDADEDFAWPGLDHRQLLDPNICPAIE